MGYVPVKVTAAGEDEVVRDGSLVAIVVLNLEDKGLFASFAE